MSDFAIRIVAIAVGVFIFCALGLSIWIWIESELEAKRLRKMREETDGKRQAHEAGLFGDGKESPSYSPQKGARFLP